MQQHADNCLLQSHFTCALPSNVPDRATLEGSSCTSIMTCTGGCGYSFNTPDDECCDTRNM